MKSIVIPSNVKKSLFTVLAVFILYNVFRILKMFNHNAQAKINSVAVQQLTHLNNDDLQTAKEVALLAYDAMYNYAFGFVIDVTGFKNALNKLSTPAQAKAASLFYSQMEKKTSLKNDMLTKIRPFVYTDINIIIRSNLQ